MSEIEIIKQRQKNIFFAGYYHRQAPAESFKLIPGDIENTLCFSDIDYKDKTRSRWKTAAHYSRIEYELQMAGQNKIETDRVWINQIISALSFWVVNDFKNPNWWYNQIGIPKSMSTIALILEDYLPPDLKDGMERLICRGSFKLNCILGENEAHDLAPSERWITADRWTGANLIWGAATTINHALWTKDYKLLGIASEKIADEICYKSEGIQPDGAFCQHGPRWYSGGYGRAFVYELAPIVYMLHGTSFAIPKERINILLSHILDGQRAMMKNGYFDFNAVGREYSRPNLVKAGSLTPAIKLLSQSESISRREELKAFYNELINEKDDFEITKYYDSICQLCHKKNDIYIGVRGRRQGIFGAEKCNNEGVLSYNMSYGTITCIMNKGKEYYNISPFWNYSKIPGTTAREENDLQLLKHESWSEMLDTPCCAKGISNAQSGILSEKAVHDGISLIASFFVYNGSMIALGTDINDETPHKGSVYTTVEQCRAFDAFIEDNFVRNGDIHYVNLDKNTVFQSSVQKKTGSWSRNELAASENILEDTVLTITIPLAEHKSYAYLVSGKNIPDVKLIRNDNACQAVVIDKDKLMAVFHEDTSFLFNGDCICGKKGEFIC